MKLIIEDDDGRVYNAYKSVTYGTTCDLATAEDWDFIFQHLKIYIETLKVRKLETTNLGMTIDLTAKIDTLEKLLKKYSKFVEIAEDSRYDNL